MKTTLPQQEKGRSQSNAKALESKKTKLPMIQAKLTIGQPNDAYEQEADRVADRVVNTATTNDSRIQKQEEEELQTKPQPSIMRMEEEEVQTKPISLIQRQDEEELQTKPADNNSPRISTPISNQINASKGNGSPMPSPIQRTMESGIGADFSGVRIHTDSRAQNLSAQLNAQAFTMGNDVYFNKGKYNPESQSGKHLLAHELTHTVQQGKSPAKSIQRMPLINDDLSITRYEFNAGQEVPLEMLRLAQQHTADGRLSSVELYELRAWAINNLGTVTDGMRLFMAGLLDPTNLAMFNGLTIEATTKFEFTTASITTANRDRIRNLNREVDTSDIDQLHQEASEAYFEDGLSGAMDKLQEREEAIEASILNLAGSSSSEMQEIIDYAKAQTISLHDLLNAMINAASDSTEGDRIMAGYAYASSAAAGQSNQGDLLSGNVKIDALTPSGFNSFFSQQSSMGAEALYVPRAWGSGETKGDTIYLKTGLDINNVTNRSSVIHEMTHAQDDNAVPQTGAMQEAPVRDLELTAYNAQARYVLNQVADTTDPQQRSQYISQTAPAWHIVFSLAMLHETHADIAKYRPVLVDMFAAHEPDPAGDNEQKATRLLAHPIATVRLALLQNIDTLYRLTPPTATTPGDTAALDGLSGESSLDWVFRI